jgi:hypothetical protein
MCLQSECERLVILGTQEGVRPCIYTYVCRLYRYLVYIRRFNALENKAKGDYFNKFY